MEEFAKKTNTTKRNTTTKRLGAAHPSNFRFFATRSDSALARPRTQFELAHGQRMEYPRDGLYLFGPCDSKSDQVHPFRCHRHSGRHREIRPSLGKMRNYIPIPVPGPRSRKIEPQHVPSRFQEAFNSEWPEKPVAAINDITFEEIEETIRIQNRHEAIHGCVDLFVSRLEDEDNRIEDPPSFWFVIIPEIVYELGRPQSRVPRADAVAGTVTMSKKKAEGLKSRRASSRRSTRS